ncbi:hypothetical protein AtNW77_Chr3g0155191 [Arabidopsis thaliana]
MAYCYRVDQSSHQLKEIHTKRFQQQEPATTSRQTTTLVSGERPQPLEAECHYRFSSIKRYQTQSFENTSQQVRT